MKTTHRRKKNTITEIETGKLIAYESINLAKKASVALSRAHGIGTVVRV